MAENQILVILPDGAPWDSALETARLARGVAATGGHGTGVAILGNGLGDAVRQLAGVYDDVYSFDHPDLDPPDASRFAASVLPLIERERPVCVLIPNTNNGMDLAPGIAVGAGLPLVTDCIEVNLDGGRLTAVRPVYGGKAHARVRVRTSDKGYVATIRPGAEPPGAADTAGSTGGPGAIHDETVILESNPRRRVLETVAPAAGGVDISKADRLVSVGRGIEDADNLQMIRSLAEALGAEVACSRPVVDMQWLEKSRQVGTSGVTVRPSLYLAVGISGSFQHLGGIKGKPFMVAINKDPRAPIFDVADVGVVGDLFDIVPLLDERIRSLKR